MAEIWVTALCCSECHRHHDEADFADSYGPDCDCWCHEDPAWTTASPGDDDDWDW